MNALAVVWHVRWESASGGLTPSSVRRYRKTIEGWQGPKRNTAWYAWRHFSSSRRAQLAGSRQDGHCQVDTREKKDTMMKGTGRGDATYAFIFFHDLDEAQLEHSFKEPGASVVARGGTYCQQ
jgi:hypothetical protein